MVSLKSAPHILEIYLPESFFTQPDIHIDPVFILFKA